MKNSNKKIRQKNVQSRSKKMIIPLCAGALILTVVIGFVILKKANVTNENGSADNLTIVKSDITDTPMFYSYKAGNTSMEIIALKASDGTIRTAFNTCQVCYSSGRGYYKVQGNTLVCQNCGNVFKFDQVEKEKGGCNPVPILEEDKTDDGTTITISADYLNQAKQIFANWKK